MPFFRLVVLLPAFLTFAALTFPEARADIAG